jgi:hypothetical protein
MASHPPFLAAAVWLISVSVNRAQTGVIAHLPQVFRADITRVANAYTEHSGRARPIICRPACAKNHVSDRKSGQRVTGVPHSCGKADSLDLFDQKLASGMAAGSHSRNGVLSCTSGVECSGLVSLCWGLRSHAYGTRNLRRIAGNPKCKWFTDMKSGDVLVKPGSRVVLFHSYNPDGTITVYEASRSASRVIYQRTTWSRLRGTFHFGTKELPNSTPLEAS